DGVGYRVVAREFLDQLGRREQRLEFADTQVIGVGRRHESSPVRASASASPDGIKKAARFAGGFPGMLLNVVFRPSATLPPPAASETCNTKNNGGLREQSWRYSY